VPQAQRQSEGIISGANPDTHHLYPTVYISQIAEEWAYGN